MYITNDPAVAQIAESAGVDRIFLDMEYIGKGERQKGMDTVQLHHTVEDVRGIRGAIQYAELLVRVNPIHEAYRRGLTLLCFPTLRQWGKWRNFYSMLEAGPKPCCCLKPWIPCA